MTSPAPACSSTAPPSISKWRRPWQLRRCSSRWLRNPAEIFPQLRLPRPALPPPVTTPDGIGADHIVQYAYNSQTERLAIVIHGDSAYGSQYRQFGQSYVPNSNLPASKGSTYLPYITYEWGPYRDTLKSITQAVGGQRTSLWPEVKYGDVRNPLDAVNNIGQRRKATYSGSIYGGSNSPQPNTVDCTYNDNGEVQTETRTGSQSNVLAERGFFKFVRGSGLASRSWSGPRRGHGERSRWNHAEAG